MEQLIVGSLILSILHALIPSHWLPVIAIGRKENWTSGKVVRVTAIAGFAHVLSTILIGIMLGLLGYELVSWVEHFTHIIGPSILVLLGIFFIYRHHAHKHFHLQEQPVGTMSDLQIISILGMSMFLSPCLEVEAYFLMAGTLGYGAIAILSGLYALITIAGMMLWVSIMYKGAMRFDWHSLEHNAGIITGSTLILTGLISYYIN